MQGLYCNPRLAVVINHRSCLKTRAFSSDSSNQSRGGLPRFFSDGSGVRVQGDEFWHMTKVLRLNTDDR
ncbi:hypothetical protein M8C21_019161 [Ambrosia artemisiifolia]|nr:hypothetical protein M8C21_019161 [Ambrosia artemisiifolia]